MWFNLPSHCSSVLIIGTECHVIKPRWIDYKDLKDMMHNLEDYVTELLEWTDTAFATVYPHDDMVLIKEWGAR